MNCDLIRGFLDGIRPSPRLTVSEWADENRILSPVGAAEPGQWRTSRTPYLKSIMDALSAYSTYQKVVVMKGAQLGFTEAGNNWIGYIIDNSPASTLMVQPTEAMVNRNSKMRIDPMIKESPVLSEKVSKQKSRSGENTITQKNFPGGMLLMAGANSGSGLRSIPVKNLFLDEVDAYPYDLNGEGSPVDLAMARTRTFANKKVFIISTPTIKDSSVIEREYLKTDQNYFNVPCPECGHFHVLIFDNLKWEEGRPKTAKMYCPECGSEILERNKTEMFSKGQWVPTHPELSSDSLIGFHLSSFYSPFGWFSWSEIAADYENIKNDPSKETTFINTILGETKSESGESPAWEGLYERREDYHTNKIPYQVCFLTAGVDIQKDRIELEIVGWCADRSSYSIDYRVLYGNPFLPEVWELLKEVVNETWTRDDGKELQLLKMAVDSGYATTEVHKFCRQFNSRVIPIKGQDKQQIPVSPPSQIDINKQGKKIGQLKQWNLGVSVLKKELYAWLAIQRTENDYPPCYCHFPQYYPNYFEGLTGEIYIEAKRKWVKKSGVERNEPLDCRVYARAASIIVGLDRMKLEKLQSMAGVFTTKQEIKKERIKKDSIW